MPNREPPFSDLAAEQARNPRSRGAGVADVTRRYDFRMTPYMAQLLRDRAHDDPLAVQFLPDLRELHALPYETSDPIGDREFSPVKGIVHRYRDRVLLKAAHSCPVYCRFCFRRDMVGHNGEALTAADLNLAIEYVRQHPEIWEVILTGGDPLSLSKRRLTDILDRLASIEHLSVLRIHSRVPIVDPAAIDEALVMALERSMPVYVVVHVNHPDELTAAVGIALRRLSRSGVVLLSQTVLLKGVNDDAQILEALFRRLVRLKVRPYYLHHPDLAPGTSHFRVSIEAGQELMRALRGSVSGLCQPTYVLDVPGGFGKVPIGPHYVGARNADGTRDLVDYQGGAHSYPE
jgi:lysine 2,3-aminomutase